MVSPLRRVAAIMVAGIIFIGVLLVIDFFVARMTEGLPTWAVLVSTAVVVLIAGTAAFESYRRNVR
jgi:hypothetical protein